MVKFALFSLSIFTTILLNNPSWSGTWDTLVERDGLFFHQNTNTLFTGKVIGEKYWLDASGSLRTWSEANFVEGKRDGLWKIYCMNGNIYSVGNYIKNKRNGDWRWYYCSGELMRTFSLENGENVGNDITYHRNGNIWNEGKWLNGKENGEWLSFGRDGLCQHKEGPNRFNTGTYKNGIKVSKCTKKCGCPSEENSNKEKM